jgi:hypothetical protein
VPIGGFPVLANGILILNGTLGASGLGNGSLVVPPGASGATIYSQAVTLDGATFGFTGATNVFTSTILL